jgi:phage shock protein PspC (stress-responsive transcriptional regulator)
MLLGVCAGLARWFETDATVVRVVAIVPLTFGLLGAGWFHFHEHLCACNPHSLLELSEWLSWLGLAAIVTYLLAALLLPQE